MNSLPGAPNNLFLDFTGRLFGDADMLAIWREVAELFSPFNVNVTDTVPQGAYHTVSVCSGQPGWTWVGSWPGVSVMDGNGLFVGSWTAPFPGWTVYCARTAAHEAGHGLGLLHQSRWVNGVKTDDYDYGDCDNASSPCTLAPLMGNFFHVKRATWQVGTNDSGQAQDDVAIISSKLGWRPTVAGHTWDTPTPLTVDNGKLSAAGVIRSLSDVDVWSFAGSGRLTMTVTPAGNLTPTLELRDALTNETLESSKYTDGVLTLIADVKAGRYIIVIASDGLSVGNIGSYTVQGTLAGPPLKPPSIDGPKSISINVKNPDGRPLTIDTVAGNRSFIVGQQLGFVNTGDWHVGELGANEVWYRGRVNKFGNPWYFLLSNLELWAWDGAKLTGEKIDVLEPDMYQHPGHIFQRQPGAWVGVTVADGVFTTNGIIPVEVK